MVAFGTLGKGKPFATINASEIYSAVGKIAALRSELDSEENKANTNAGGSFNEEPLHGDGISITNKTNSNSNSTYGVLTIGENFITKW